MCQRDTTITVQILEPPAEVDDAQLEQIRAIMLARINQMVDAALFGGRKPMPMPDALTIDSTRPPAPSRRWAIVGYATTSHDGHVGERMGARDAARR